MLSTVSKLPSTLCPSSNPFQAKDEDAIAEPYPKVLNFIKVIIPVERSPVFAGALHHHTYNPPTLFLHLYLSSVPKTLDFNDLPIF
jgi:hypothetical protein